MAERCSTCNGTVDPAAGVYCATCTPMPEVEVQSARGYINELETSLDACHGRLVDARGQRDAWVRLWNRLEAAISHHRNAKLRGVDTSDNVDEALWAARDRVLRAAHSKDLDSLGQNGNRPDDAIQVSIDHGSPNSQPEKLGERPQTQQELGHDSCPTCGAPVTVVAGDEGTSHYEPA